MVTISFYGWHKDDYQHNSTILPIYEEMKRQGLNANWFEGGDYYVFSTNCPNRNKGFYHPHGLGAHEYAWHGDSMGVLVPGPTWMGFFKKKWPKYHDRHRMVGWPKSDLLFSPEKDKIKEHIEERLKLPYDRTVLWADTFFSGSMNKILQQDWVVKLLDKVYSVTKELKLNLIIKPHYKRPAHNDRIAPKKFERPWVRWIDSCDPDFRDVTRLFLVSDLLLAIHADSSVTTEFMVTEKPILKAGGGGFFSVFEDGEWIKSKFPDFKCSTEELKHGINYALDHPEENSEEKKEWVEKLIYKPDGNASKRAVDVIMEMTRGR